MGLGHADRGDCKWNKGAIYGVVGAVVLGRQVFLLLSEYKLVSDLISKGKPSELLTVVSITVGAL